MRLIACHRCEELVLAGTCVCPHCGTGGVCRRTAALPAAALMLGLALSGCDEAGMDDDIQPAYGVAIVDEDGDGWGVDEGDCDDTDDTIHPEAEEIPDDGVDSNCDGDDNT